MTRPPILIITPDAALAQTVASALQFAGFQPVPLARASALPGLSGTSPPVLAVIDLGTEDLAGLEAIRQWKAAPQTCAIPLLAMSRDALDGEQARFASRACAGYSLIGGTARDLIKMIQVILHQPRPRTRRTP